MKKLAKSRLASYRKTVFLTHLQKNHLSTALIQCDTTERLVAHVNDKSVLLSANEDLNLLTQVPLASYGRENY